MPSANTKPLASRVSKDEYFILLREAAERQMTLSQFVKDVVINNFISSLNKLERTNRLLAKPYKLAEKGIKLETPPVKSPVKSREEALAERGLFELVEVLPDKDLYQTFYFLPCFDQKGTVTLGAVEKYDRLGNWHYYPEEKQLLFSSIYTSKGRYFLNSDLGSELYEFDLKHSPILSIKEGNLYFNPHPHHHHPSREPKQARFGKTITHSISATKWLNS